VPGSSPRAGVRPAGEIPFGAPTQVGGSLPSISSETTRPWPRAGPQSVHPRFLSTDIHPGLAFRHRYTARLRIAWTGTAVGAYDRAVRESSSFLSS